MSTYFNIEDSVYIDNSGNMGIGITNPSKKLEVDGDISFGNSTISGHMIPDADDTYDIGSADYKIRDLYVSDNSMWVGDSHKISISGGKMKFRKRKTSVVPASILAAGGTELGAIGNSEGINSLEDMKLKHWKKYMRTLANQSGATIQDIFTNDAADYIEDSGSYNWLESGTKTFLTSGNVGIGTQDPAALLSLHYNPEASVGLKELLRLSWHDINYDTLRGDGTKISFHTSNVDQYPGTVEAGYFGVMKANAVEANTESDITIANNDGTNMVERIRILSDGKVGIGDFTSVLPGYKLDVVGDINLTGSIYINDQAQTFASSLTVKESDGSPSISSVDTIEFDQDSGFIVTNPSSGTAKIALGSHWKELYVNGQTTLSPSGQESLELIAGSNVTITTNDSSSPQAVTFASTDTDTQLTQEQVEDYVNGLIVAGSNITKTYDDSAGTLTIASTASGGSSVWSESNSVASYMGNVKIEHSSGSKWIFQPTESFIGLSKSGSGSYDFTFGVLNDSYLESYLSIGGGLIKFNCNGNSWFNGGNVGIGTNNPQHPLDINNASLTLPLVLLRNGQGNSAFNDGAQIKFSYYGTENYAHFIQTRHNSADSKNAIDFYLCDGTESNSLTSGADHVMSLVSGDVGIGTKSPSYKLDVVGDINLTGDLRQNGSIVSFGGGGSSVWSESNSEASYMGNVGIGIADPQTQLHIYDDSAEVKLTLQSDSGGASIYLDRQANTNQGVVFFRTNGSDDWIIGCDNSPTGNVNDFSIKTTNNGTPEFVIDTSGNVGIGTPEPNCKLNIVGAKNGEVRLEVENETDGTASKITIRAQGNGGNIGIQRFNASYTTSGAEIADGCLLSTGTGDSGGLGIRARASTGEIMLYTAGDNERMRIDASGNVGIGNTDPDALLHLGDVENTKKLLYFHTDRPWHVIQGGSGSGASLDWMSSNGGKRFRIIDEGTGNIVFTAQPNTTASSQRVYLCEDGGNVGIGNISPGELLDVRTSTTTTYQGARLGEMFCGTWANTAYAQIAHQNVKDTSTSYALIQKSDGETFINAASGKTLHFRNANSEKMTILSSGKVGIGENNPRNELHLRGWMFFQGPSTNDNYGWKVGTAGTGNDEENFNFYRVRNNTESRWAFIEDDQSAVDKLDFTGQHRNRMKENNDEYIENINEYIGLIVCASGEFMGEIKINEALPLVELSNESKQKTAFGVISDGEDKNNDYREYKQGNFVSVIHKEENDERVIINSLGEGAVWVCDVNGSIENGDYITTTEFAHGYGVKQDDDFLHNYTVAKMTQNEDFSDMTDPEFSRILENGVKCKFVGCTYHCG